MCTAAPLPHHYAHSYTMNVMTCYLIQSSFIQYAQGLNSPYFLMYLLLLSFFFFSLQTCSWSETVTFQKTKNILLFKNL